MPLNAAFDVRAPSPRFIVQLRRRRRQAVTGGRTRVGKSGRITAVVRARFSGHQALGWNAVGADASE